MRLRRSSKWKNVRREGGLLREDVDDLAGEHHYLSKPHSGHILAQEVPRLNEWESLLAEESSFNPKLSDYMTHLFSARTIHTAGNASEKKSQSTISTRPENETSLVTPTSSYSLEKAVMELQIKYSSYAERKQEDAAQYNTTIVSQADGCFLYDSVIRLGGETQLQNRRQTVLLQSPVAAALVGITLSNIEGSYGPYRLLMGTQNHVDFLEDLVGCTESIDLDVLATAWHHVTSKGKLESSHKNDYLSKALGASSLLRNGNLRISHFLQAEARELGGLPGVPVEQHQDKCPICLEHFDDGDNNEASLVQMDGCNHKFCHGCAVSYMQSCPRGRLPCPAGNRCGSMMGIADILHISTNASESHDDALQSVLDHELEQFCVAKRNGRNCPNPLCGRLLASESRTAMDAGWNILHCACATQTLCGSCHERAHPGVSCAEYGKWRKSIDSGKADAETESLRYITERSFPCPRCTFAIEKDGGCNHMRCTKCDHYFCFQCGGPGNECMAFYCRKTRKYWHQNESEGVNAFASLKKQQRVYVRFRLLEKRLERTDRSLRRQQGFKNAHSALLLERQITLVQLWVQGYLLMQKTEDFVQAERCWMHLELVRQASYLRDDGRPVTKSQARIVVDKCLGSDVDEFVRQTAVMDLMAMISTNNFQTDVAAAFQRVIDCLPNAKGAQNQRKRARKATVQTSLSTAAALNTRQQRAADPWQRGFHRTCPRSEPAPRWKGKLKRPNIRFQGDSLAD